MNALTRYTPRILSNPFDLQIDRLFDEAFRALSDKEPASMPDGNAWEDAERFCVEIALPGYERKDIQLTVEEGVLTVKGGRKDEPSADGRTYSIREWTCGPFSRSFWLPSYVDHDKATASYRDGVLRIEFPKREEAKPRHIMIESKESTQ